MLKPNSLFYSTVYGVRFEVQVRGEAATLNSALDSSRNAVKLFAIILTRLEIRISAWNSLSDPFM